MCDPIKAYSSCFENAFCLGYFICENNLQKYQLFQSAMKKRPSCCIVPGNMSTEMVSVIDFPRDILKVFKITYYLNHFQTINFLMRGFTVLLSQLLIELTVNCQSLSSESCQN